MRRFARYLTAFLLATGAAAWGLTSIVAYKTFTREILTSADLNSSFSRVVTAANNLIALHPGDSTVTVRGVFDTLDASPGPNLNVIRTMVFRDNQDSLVVPGRISADTVKVDDQLWIRMSSAVVGFSGGATAGTRLTFGSLVGVDSLRVRDSLNVQPGARSYLPRARIDSLLSGTATATVGFASSFTAGSRLNLGSVVRADSIWTGTTTPVVGFTAGSTAGTRFLWAYAKHDSNVVTWSDINGGTIDGTVIGGSTAAAGSFTKVAGSIAAQFSGGLTTNTLQVTGKLTLAALRDTLMDAVRDTVGAAALAFSDGTSALPALTNLGDLNTGIYFPAADQMGVSVNGVRALLVSGDDITVRDDANVGDDLNLTSSGAVLNFNSSDVTLTHAANTLTLAGATSGYVFNGNYASALTIGGASYPGFTSAPAITAANQTAYFLNPTFSGGNANDATLAVYGYQGETNPGSLKQIAVYTSVTAAKTLTNYYGLYIYNPAGSGAITTNYGIYLEDQTKGTTDYAIYSTGGAIASGGDVIPTTDEGPNLGSVAATWDSVFASVALVVGDIPYLETRDDVKDIRSIRPHPTKVDPLHGYPLVDDRTLPDVIVHCYPEDGRHVVRVDSLMVAGKAQMDTTWANHTRGEKVFRADSTAFVNPIAAIGQLQGAIRQLASHVDSLTAVTARQDSLIAALAVRMAKLEAR